MGNEQLISCPGDYNDKVSKKQPKKKQPEEFKIKLIRCQTSTSEDSDCESLILRKTLYSLNSNSKLSPSKYLFDSSQKSPFMSQCSEIDHSPKEAYQKAHYKFNWPIWFKYFTNIYVSKWWRNYYWMNWIQLMKIDIKEKGNSKDLRWIFWGKSPLTLDKVNPDEMIISYKDSPLRALQSKLSISGLLDSDSKISSEK